MKSVKMGLIFTMIFGLMFFGVGCAKKAEQKAEEVKPPVEAKVEQPAPKPVEEAKASTKAPMPSLEDDIKAFEDKNIYFDFDKFNLSQDARDVLSQKSDFLKAHTNLTIQIEGHCDERGTTEYNLALGEKRAKAAQDYLLSLGMGADRISIISYGKEKPVDPGHDEAAWSKNRRDHFAIVNK